MTSQDDSNPGYKYFNRNLLTETTSLDYTLEWVSAYAYTFISTSTVTEGSY